MFSVLRAFLLVVVVILLGESGWPGASWPPDEPVQGAAMQIPEKIPDNQLPLSLVDRRIDLLGAESNIHSTADAETYIGAILAKYRFDVTAIPGLRSLEDRLAAAEFAAITNPTKRIGETQVAEAFNQIMDEWGTEQWTRISVEDLHIYRRIKAATLNPYSVSRAVDGSVSERCRPVEALYIIFLLSIERGTQSGPKPRIPDNFGMSPLYAQKSTLKPNTPDPIEAKRNRAYLEARNAWLQKNFDPVQEVDLLFKTLQIT
jgi:hypothetical protein